MTNKKQSLKELLILFKSERKQFLYLTLIVLAFIVFRQTVHLWYKPDRPTLSELQSRVVLVNDTIRNSNDDELKVTPNYFDINEGDLDDWMSLGFSLKQAKVILNYKNKIGGFKSVEGLSKVFIIDSVKYQNIEPFVYVTEQHRNINTAVEVVEAVSKERSIRKWNLNNFNPNTIDKVGLITLGFKENEINNILNYRNKVGDFQDTTDFKNLYAISESDMSQIIPYISIAVPKDTLVEIEEVVEVLDLNTCDSLDLVNLRGIGPYYSKLILNYRNRLGGFITVNQLYEIEKLPRETIDKLKDNFVINSGFEPKKMNLNSNDFKRFMRHPYFSYAYTKKIFDYRNSNGNYTSLQDLKKVNFLDSKYHEKIAPYLRVK